VLRDVRVRQAIAYAIDRNAIIEYLRRGLGVPAVGLLPALSWAFAADAFSFPYDPARARALLDEAGYLDPDGDGPKPRLRLSLKTSSTLEFNRLQATVIQQNLRAVGIDLDVRSYEWATFYDVLKGNFQIHAAVDGGLAGRSRHPAAGLPLDSGAASGLQPRGPQPSRRCPARPGGDVGRSGTPD
jgi:peptide/nickel transport system substrate-binding protein